jgi:DNA-binding CsgD family transcriptional regulator
LGRNGETDAARAAADEAERQLTAMPAFAGWAFLGYRWVATDAIRDGWGEPATWMSDASAWFASKGLDAPAAACRGLAAKAGVRTRRRGRGSSVVPQHLDRLAVTSREVDVLRLVAQGLTNAEIADRLYLSPRTVKGYVEQLLAKTGTANRTQLARQLDGR